MADFDFDFDEDAKPDAGPSGGGGVIKEEGPFEWEVVNSDVTATADGTGLKLEIEAHCLSEPYVGRRVYDSFNIKNKSAQAQRIGQDQVLAMCAAMGLPGRPPASDDLHHKPFWAKIKVDKYFSRKHNENREKNVFKQFMHEGSKEAAAQPPETKSAPRETAPSAPQTSGASAGGGAPSRPWLKK